jgi:APA family basic amino acid/polyamine antiporter
MKRSFRVPGSPVVPALSALGALYLIFRGLPLMTIVSYLTWLVIGLVVYFAYSRRRSKLAGDTVAAPASS